VVSPDVQIASQSHGSRKLNLVIYEILENFINNKKFLLKEKVYWKIKL